MALPSDGVWLITGCSSGFGKELALAALGKGFRVIATARKLEALDPLARQGASVLQLDVTDSVDNIAKFAQKALNVQ